jgi:RNA polymerase sigma factor (sigma-70 family)
MDENEIELQKGTSPTEHAQDILLSSIQYLETSTPLEDEEKYEAAKLITSFSENSEEIKHLPFDLFTYLGYSLNPTAFESIDKKIIADLNSENIASMIYLHSQGIKINKILKRDDLLNLSFERISEQYKIYKEFNLDIENVFHFHPEFNNIDSEEIIFRIKEGRKLPPLNKAEEEKIRDLEIELENRLVETTSYYKLANPNHRILEDEEVGLLFFGYQKLNYSLHSKESLYRDKERIESIILLFNQRLVISRSRHYVMKFLEFVHDDSRAPLNYQDYEDILQSASVGLFKAIRNFKLESENDFSTYATHWIDGTLMNSNKNSFNMIKIPAYLFPDLKLYKEQRDLLEGEGVANPNFDQVMDYCDAHGIEFANNRNYIQSALSVNYVYLNLDKAEFDEEGEEEGVIDKLTDNSNLPEEEIILKENKQEIDNILNELGPRNKYIVMNRADYTIQEKLFLETLGKLFGISGQAVSFIEQNAAKKLIPSLKEVYSY